MELISVKCPDCGMSLDLQDDRQQAFCSYCGAKLILQNENEFVVRHVDEAAVKNAEVAKAVQLKRAEVEHDIQIKQMEAAEKAQTTFLQNTYVMRLLSLSLGGVGILLLIIGYAVESQSKLSILFLIGILLIVAAIYIWKKDGGRVTPEGVKDAAALKVKVPKIAEDFSKKNYAAVEAAFKSAGFTNVKVVPLKNLTFGVVKKPGFVESVTINGQVAKAGSKKYSKDADVVITYHSLSERKS